MPPSPLYAPFHLIAFRGLRRGEACGARWEFLDVEERTLAMEKQLVQIGWDGLFGSHEHWLYYPGSSIAPKHIRRPATPWRS